MLGRSESDGSGWFFFYVRLLSFDTEKLLVRILPVVAATKRRHVLPPLHDAAASFPTAAADAGGRGVRVVGGGEPGARGLHRLVGARR